MLLGNVPVNVIRRGAAAIVDSVYVTGPEVVIAYDEGAGFGVQPLNDADYRLLPERILKSVRLKVYVPSTIELQTISLDAPNEASDLIEYNGQRYYLYALKGYPTSGLFQHRRFYLVEPEGVQGDA